MEFNIRAISLAGSIPPDARIEVEQMAGKRIDFRAGLSYSLTLPAQVAQLARVAEPERLFTAVEGWARVYGYRRGNHECLHVIAPSEAEDGSVIFYRLDFRQALKSRRGPRPPVEVAGGAVMSYEDCAAWLINLAASWRAETSQENLRFVIIRPAAVNPTLIRLAWVAPEAVENRSVRDRLLAIGSVYGVEIVHVPPRGYRDTKARLASSLPYGAAIICRHFAPHIGAEAVPEAVPRELIHFCDSTKLSDLETQIRVWVEVVVDEIEGNRRYESADEEAFLLGLMVRAMLRHSKIGQFSHCPKETVLKVIRSRHLNVPAAERILDQHSESHEDTKATDRLFLWKEHHDGRQYFLNPKKVEEAKTMTSSL